MLLKNNAWTRCTGKSGESGFSIIPSSKMLQINIRKKLYEKCTYLPCDLVELIQIVTNITNIKS